MLSQLVRPMVRTQIQLLANSNATRSTLMTTIAQWLGFLGVQANVQKVDAISNQIQVSITVGKPAACNAHDWEKILKNLTLDGAEGHPSMIQPEQMTDQQKSRFYRLLAYVIQVGYPEQKVPAWEEIKPQIQILGFSEDDLAGIQSALKVPQNIDSLMKDLDPDVAAIALSKSVSLALLDHRVNSTEDQALSLLLDAIKQGTPAA